MTHSILIKTCSRDIHWLHYCLKSIHKFVSGFDEIVIVAPADEREFDTLGLTRERLIYEPEPGKDGYTWQQVVKLHADQYTWADYILFVDSDCIFHTPVTPDYFKANGKPYCLFTPYEKLDKVPWRPGTEFVMGHDVPFEFMRRHPMMYAKGVLKAFREFIEKRFNQSCRDFMLANCHKHCLSEFNILGAFAYYVLHDEIVWYSTIENSYPPACLHQFWSYSGIDGKENFEKLTELKKLLE